MLIHGLTKKAIKQELFAHEELFPFITEADRFQNSSERYRVVQMKWEFVGLFLHRTRILWKEQSAVPLVSC